MKIFEITPENEFLARIKGINLKTEETFEYLEMLFESLQSIKSPQLNNTWLYTIEHLEEELQSIINEDFYDDPDIDNIKNDARKILKYCSEQKIIGGWCNWEHYRF